MDSKSCQHMTFSTIRSWAWFVCQKMMILCLGKPYEEKPRTVSFKLLMPQQQLFTIFCAEAFAVVPMHYSSVGHYSPASLFSSVKWSNQDTATAAAKSLQSCPTLCDPIDGSPPGSPVPGILQPRTLEWVAISFSNA